MVNLGELPHEARLRRVEQFALQAKSVRYEKLLRENGGLFYLFYLIRKRHSRKISSLKLVFFSFTNTRLISGTRTHMRQKGIQQSRAFTRSIRTA